MATNGSNIIRKKGVEERKNGSVVNHKKSMRQKEGGAREKGWKIKGWGGLNGRLKR